MLWLFEDMWAAAHKDPAMRHGQDLNLVPAPLLRATHRSGALLMPMPLTYDNEHAT